MRRLESPHCTPQIAANDRSTPMLLPPDLRDWLPQGHIVHFLIEALETIPTTGAKVNVRKTGSGQYPPLIMLGLLIYGYATGRFSSREIEGATYSDVPMRYLSANTYPDHDTICTFRRENGKLINDALVSVLQTAKEMKLLTRAFERGAAAAHPRPLLVAGGILSARIAFPLHGIADSGALSLS